MDVEARVEKIAAGFLRLVVKERGRITHRVEPLCQHEASVMLFQVVALPWVRFDAQYCRNVVGQS